MMMMIMMMMMMIIIIIIIIIIEKVKKCGVMWNRFVWCTLGASYEHVEFLD
jgi:hypothetical protein